MTTQQMLSKLRKGITDYKLIKDGDKIAVGISGGKDSLALLQLLAEYQKFSPQKFSLIAITVDLQFDNKPADYSKIQALCDSLGVTYFVERTEIAEIVFNVRKETNPCALCSKMRKGALYDKAKLEGCNKVALGHHQDDLIDTFIMSMFYEGRLNTFAPKSFLDRTGLTLIRPMLYLSECEIASFSKDLPVYESNCPANKQTHREKVKDIIKVIAKDVKNVREMLFTAITHPERYNLFDRFIRDCDEID